MISIKKSVFVTAMAALIIGISGCDQLKGTTTSERRYT